MLEMENGKQKWRMKMENSFRNCWKQKMGNRNRNGEGNVKQKLNRSGKWKILKMLGNINFCKNQCVHIESGVQSQDQFRRENCAAPNVLMIIKSKVNV